MYRIRNLDDLMPAQTASRCVAKDGLLYGFGVSHARPALKLTGLDCSLEEHCSIPGYATTQVVPTKCNDETFCIFLDDNINEVYSRLCLTGLICSTLNRVLFCALHHGRLFIPLVDTSVSHCCVLQLAGAIRLTMRFLITSSCLL